MGKRDGGLSGNKGQAALLKRLVLQAYIAVGTGVILLLGFIAFNIGMSRVHTDQLNTVIALNSIASVPKH